MSEDVDGQICERYEIHKRLGKGAYGIVWKATDRRSNDIVALKKIFDAFRKRIQCFLTLVCNCTEFRQCN